MALAINARDRNLISVIQSLLDRIRKLERPVTLRLGGIGGQINGNGFTLALDANGNLLATSDSGCSTVLAYQVCADPTTTSQDDSLI